MISKRKLKIASKETLYEAIFETHLRKVQLYIENKSRTFLIRYKKRQGFYLVLIFKLNYKLNLTIVDGSSTLNVKDSVTKNFTFSLV